MKFVEAMLGSISKEQHLKKNIMDEKVKMKILQPLPDKLPVFDISEMSKEDNKQKLEIKKRSRIDLEKESKMDENRKRPIHLTNAVGKVFPRRVNPVSQQNQIMKGLSGVQKISRLLADRGVQSIECPGPEKYLIIKVRNQLNLTRIVLSSEDILNVITDFSEKARIPISGGILKAAVGDLLISAVVSQVVGSRFIISRKTAYSLIEGKKPLPKI